MSHLPLDRKHTHNAAGLQLPVNQDNALCPGHMRIALQRLLGHSVQHGTLLYARDMTSPQLSCHEA